MKLLSILLIACIYSTSSLANVRMWIAAKTGNKIITSYDVQKFSMAMELSDGAMISLFNKSGGDYDKYQEEVVKWLSPRFEKNLKVMVYSQVIKRKAIREDHNKNFFNMTTKQFLKEIDKAEDRVLGQLLKEGKGIVKSRKMYGQFLIDSQFPHLKSESATDVYHRWFKLTKARIKVETLLKEVKKFETYMALNNPNDIYRGGLDGLEVWEFYDSAKKKLKNINGKKLSVAELQNILKRNQSVKVLTENFNHHSILSTPFSELKKKRSDMNETIKSFHKTMSSKVFNDRVHAYIKKAGQLKQKYGSTSQLEDKKEQAVNSFIKTGEDKHMMLAHLYTIALDSSKAQESVDRQINQASNAILNALENPIKGENFIQLTQRSLLGVSNKGNTKEQMIHFMLVFEAKKLAIADKGLVEITLKKYKDIKTIDLIKNTLRMEKYKKGLKRFRKDLKVENSWSLRINKLGSYEMDRMDAAEFVFGKN